MATFDGCVREVDDLSCLYQLGRTGALSWRHLEQARAALEQYMTRELDPDRHVSLAGARWRLGMIYEHMGRKDLARAEYEKALVVDPDMDQAREALEKLE